MMLDTDQYEEYEEQHAIWEVSPYEIEQFIPMLIEHIKKKYEEKIKPLKKPDAIVLNCVWSFSTETGLYGYFANYDMDIDSNKLYGKKEKSFIIEATLNDQEVIGEILAKFDKDGVLNEWLKVEGISYHYQLAKGLIKDGPF
jgi:hypothetical protein